MAALGTALARLAQGDLRTRIDAGLAPEFASVTADFNAAAASLERAVGAAAAAAQTVGQGVHQIGAAAGDLSRRTEQQAANLEETAAALEQITATVRKSAAGAGEASQAVGGAREEAERSGAVVSQAIGARPSTRAAMSVPAGDVTRISRVVRHSSASRSACRRMARKSAVIAPFRQASARYGALKSPRVPARWAVALAVV